MFKANFITAKNLLRWNADFNLELTNRLLKKGELLLEAGRSCNYFYYISKGCLRIYYLDLNGKEVTHWFSAEDSIATSPNSFFKKEENILFIEALEDTEVVLISTSQLKKISKNAESADTEIRKLYIEFIMAFSIRIIDINTKTATERYLDLIAEHPYLLQKSKLAYIASYLGITQQSLSRIRKNI